MSAVNAVRAQHQQVSEQILGGSDEAKVIVPEENPFVDRRDLEAEKSELDLMKEELAQKDELLRQQAASYKALQLEVQEGPQKTRQELLMEILAQDKQNKAAQQELRKQKKRDEVAERKRLGEEVRKKMQEEKYKLTLTKKAATKIMQT